MEPYEFEDGVTSENAKRYILVHGGSEELAEKFYSYCLSTESGEDKYSQDLQDNIEILFCIVDISDEDIVAQLAVRL